MPSWSWTATFYALPLFKQLAALGRRDAGTLVFDVKLFRTFMPHQTPLKSLPRALSDEMEELTNKAGNLYCEELLAGLRRDIRNRDLDPNQSAGRVGPGSRARGRQASWL